MHTLAINGTVARWVRTQSRCFGPATRADPLTVKDLARHAGWAPRTFARYFLAETSTTPLRWLTAQRLLQARRLLEVSDLSVEQIAARCGLGTAANLRLHLARDTSTTPTAYRRTYQGSSPSTPDSHDGT